MFRKIIEHLNNYLADYKYLICYEKIEKNIIVDKILERKFFYAKSKEDAEIFRDYLLVYYDIKLNKDTIVSSKTIRELVFISSNNSFRLNQFHGNNINNHFLFIIDFRQYSDIFSNILIEPYIYFEEVDQVTKEYIESVYKSEITKDSLLVIGYECRQKEFFEILNSYIILNTIS